MNHAKHRPSTCLLFLTCTVLATMSVVVSAQVNSTFDSDLEGWMVTGDNSAAWESVTGNPNGCLSVNDHATGDHNLLVAPPAYLGDWSGFSPADTLSFDVYLDNTSGGGQATSPFMMRIAGPGGSAMALDPLANYPPQQSWTTYQAALDPADWTIESGSWAAILASVTSVMLEGEFVDGDEIVRVDNVQLSATPATLLIPCEYDDFSGSGTGDWTFAGTSGVSNPGSGGNGGGYARVTDQSGPNSYALAPSRFRGDWTAFDGNGRVTIDLRILDPGSVNTGAPEFIRLSGPGGSAYVALDPADIPVSDKVWKTFEYPVEAAFWTVDTGTWSELLAEVSECRIDLEFYTGLETVGFDNFGRLDGDCPPIDDPVQVHDPAMDKCGWHSLVGVNGVALNPLNGELYATIAETSSSGGGLYQVTGAGAGVRLAAFDRPAHLIFAGDGDAFVSENIAGDIHRLEWGGNDSTWVSGFHSGDDDPYGLAFAPPGFNGPNVGEGDILVTDFGYNGPDEIWAFSPDSAEGERQVMPDQGETDHVDLASSASGAVYVCDALDPDHLYTLSPDGTLLSFALSTPVGEMVSLVHDDIDGYLYVAGTLTESVFRVDPASGTVVLVADGFADLAWGCLEIDNGTRELWVGDQGAGRAYKLCLPGWAVPTVAAQYSCLPSAGTVPFSTTMAVTFTNLYAGQTRRLAGRIGAELAGGTNIDSWRSGFTNIPGGSSYFTSWSQTIPALAGVIGINVFTLAIEDVTPSPYNQPPYPPAGDTDTAACMVSGTAP